MEGMPPQIPKSLHPPSPPTVYEELLYVEEQPLDEYDVLQHFPAHQSPATFPSSGDYEPVIGGAVYSTLSGAFMDDSVQQTLPNTPHEYEVIRHHPTD